MTAYRVSGTFEGNTLEVVFGPDHDAIVLRAEGSPHGLPRWGNPKALVRFCRWVLEAVDE